MLLRKWKSRKQLNKNLEGQLWLRKGQKKENWEEAVSKVNIWQKLPSNSIWKGMSRYLDPNTFFIPSIRKNINAGGLPYSFSATLPQITHLFVTIKIQTDQFFFLNYPEKHQLWTPELAHRLHWRVMNVRKCTTAALQNTRKDFKFSREFQVLLPASPIRHSNLHGFNPILHSENRPNNKLNRPVMDWQ